MITIEDLNISHKPLTDEQGRNLNALAFKLTKLEDKFGSLFKITSGFRSIEDQYHIYRLRGIDTPPLHSQHLFGNAADIWDPRKTLQDFLLSERGLQALEDIGLWCEHFDCCQKPSPWVHCQQVAPASGSRFFIP